MLVNIVVYLLVLFPIVCPLTTPRAFKQQKLSLRPFHLYMKTDVANDIMSQRISLLVNSNPSPPLLEFIRCAVSSLKREIFLNQLTDKSDAVEVLFADTQQQDNKVSQQKRLIYLTTDDQYSETISADAAFVFVLPTKLAEEPQSASYQQLCRKLADLLVRVGSSDELRREALVAAGDWSHFLSLTYANIDDALPHLPELTVGVDALELRVDLLDDLSVASVHRQIAVLRSACDLPIVFTVRSKNQIGRFPDDAPDHMFKLLGEGLRASVDWLDVEGCWPESYVKPLCVRAREQYSSTSCLLGSLHVTVPQTEDQIRGLFQTASLYGQADILKVVTGAKDDDDCKRIHKVGEQLDKPYIGVCLGAAGSLSRVLNRRFTPVTHPRMAAAAPGQLSVQQLMDQRQQLGLIKSKQFFLFGTPIQQSLSPAMHNGAFKQLLLPHTYALDEQQDIKSYESTLFSDNFGGASVTIPHKESILPYLSEVKSPADIIGAVNTIIVEETIATSTDKNSPNPASRRLVGYNTDWLGILVPVRRKLEMLWGADGWVSTDATGLVVGAGGTAKAACYAVQKLGLKLLVTNRDEEKGKDLANRFNGTFVKMSELETVCPSVVVSTIPFQAGFTLPEGLLRRLDTQSNKPVIMDVVYKPARTPLLDQALSRGYACVQGGSMLYEQGAQQFELWNKRKAPRAIMKNAVFNGIETLDE